MVNLTDLKSNATLNVQRFRSKEYFQFNSKHISFQETYYIGSLSKLCTLLFQN